MHSVKVLRSPDVAITGTLSFRDRQNALAKDTDAAYNMSLHAKNISVTHSARKVASIMPAAPGVVNVDDYVRGAGPGAATITTPRLVILQEKNPLVFPLRSNSRFPVSDDDIMHYCAIVELAYKLNIQKYVYSVAL